MSDVDNLFAPGDMGNVPQVSEDLKADENSKYAITSATQAYAIVEKLIQGWRDGIANQQAITAQLNGQRPRDPGMLKQLGRDWIPNINTGFLRTETGKIPARLWMPIARASYLTAARLPTSHPLFWYKSELFRKTITEAVRRWRKWPWFMRLLAREVGVFGFGFAVFFDEYEWRPTFVRQDRGFVPAGTEILDENWSLFAVAYDYQVPDLIQLVEKAEKSGNSPWNKEAVAKAIMGSGPKSPDTSYEGMRAWEELVRQANLGYCYEKGFNVVQTYHVFSRDADGSISHHIVVKSTGGQGAPVTTSGDSAKYLFEKRNQFKSMDEVVVPMYFEPDDGTVQGSWGGGQMMFDLSLETEKAFNDWLMSLKQAAKIKTQTSAGRTPDEVRLDVDDVMMLVTNGVYAGNTAAVVTDPRPFATMAETLGQMSREKVGSYIPPIPTESVDIKSAQINAKMSEQAEVREQSFQSWLWQFALLMEQMSRRLCRKDATDAEAKKVRETLLEKMESAELEILTNQPQVYTIDEFTQAAAQRRAAFAASKSGNPFYNQKRLETIQATAAGGIDFAETVLLPGEDETVERMARREQQFETATMMGTGEYVDVLPMDADWYHMIQLRPKLEETLMEAGPSPVIGVMLKHYEAHWVAAVAKKGIPKDRINTEKSFIAKMNNVLETGRMPPEGFEDQPDPIEAAQAQLATRERVSRSPTVETQESAIT